MELRHLRYFVAVAEEQNVTRAAARLHVSQPPLSRQIRDLEAELGVTLLERGARSVTLTEPGRVFLEEARAILRRVDEATAAMHAVARGNRGALHIGYAPSLTVEVLPLALRRFQQRAPGVKVTLHDLSTEAMLVGLREKRLHAALMIRPSPRAQRGLLFQEIRRFHVCVAVPPAHPLARKRSVSLSAVQHERLIGYGRGEYPEYHEWLAELFRPMKVQPAVGEDHDSATSLIAAVEAGHGVAIVPEVLACLAGPRLKLLRVSGAMEPFAVGVARAVGKPAPWVAEFLAAAMEPGTLRSG